MVNLSHPELFMSRTRLIGVGLVHKKRIVNLRTIKQVQCSGWEYMFIWRFINVRYEGSGTHVYSPVSFRSGRGRCGANRVHTASTGLEDIRVFS